MGWDFTCDRWNYVNFLHFLLVVVDVVFKFILSDRRYRSERANVHTCHKKMRNALSLSTACYRVHIINYNFPKKLVAFLPVGAFRVVLQLCAAEFRLCKGCGRKENWLMLTAQECSGATISARWTAVLVHGTGG